MGHRDGRGPIQGGGGGASVLDAWQEVNATTIRPKAPYTSVLIPGDLEVQGDTTLADQVIATGDIYAGAAFDLGFTGRAKFKSPADGIVTLLNAAESGFTRMQYGGTTAAFPAIKRNATALNFRLADDSADAPITAGTATFSGAVLPTGGVALGAVAAASLWSALFLSGNVTWTDGAGARDTAVGRSAAGKVALYGASDAVGANLAFASDKVIQFSSTTDPDGTVDTSIGRSAANVVALYGGTGTTTGAALVLASDMGVRFSSTTDPDGTVDLVLGRSAAGVLALYNETTRTTGASLALASDKVVNWSSTTDPDGSADTGLKRIAAGVVACTDGSSGDGRLWVHQGTAASAALQLGDTDTGFWRDTAGGSAKIGVTWNGSTRWAFYHDTNSFTCASNVTLAWINATGITNQAVDTQIGRSAAAVVGFYGSALTNGASIALASGMWVQWSSDADPDTAYDTAVIRAAAGILAPQSAAAGTGDWKAPKSSITTGTMTRASDALVRKAIHKFTWTNAQVQALGATTAGDILVGTLPAKFVVTNAYIVIDTAAGTVTTLTVSCGRTGASYIDYIVASDAKAAANTVYGDTSAERGTNLTGYDLPSYTGTTAVNAHFISTGGNLNTVTTSTGTVFIEGYVLP